MTPEPEVVLSVLGPKEKNLCRKKCHRKEGSRAFVRYVQDVRKPAPLLRVVQPSIMHTFSNRLPSVLGPKENNLFRKKCHRKGSRAFIVRPRLGCTTFNAQLFQPPPPTPVT